VAVLAGRPGRVADAIDVDAAERGDTFRADPRYAAWCLRASAALKAAVA
jgi:hypothetical protein